MTTVIAFDVNETLLDLRALDPHFEVLFGSAALRAQWFAQMLQLSFVGGLTGHYVDFTAAQRAALQMLGERQGVALDDATVTETVDRMRTLPPHPEVAETLRTLAGTTLRLVALTNSTAEVAQAQLTHAGLRDLFEAALSADTVRASSQRLPPTSTSPRNAASRCLRCGSSPPTPGTCRARSPPAPRPRSWRARGWSSLRSAPHLTSSAPTLPRSRSSSSSAISADRVIRQVAVTHRDSDHLPDDGSMAP